MKLQAFTPAATIYNEAYESNLDQKTHYCVSLDNNTLS